MITRLQSAAGALRSAPTHGGPRAWACTSAEPRPERAMMASGNGSNSSRSASPQADRQPRGTGQGIPELPSALAAPWAWAVRPVVTCAESPATRREVDEGSADRDAARKSRPHRDDRITHVHQPSGEVVTLENTMGRPRQRRPCGGRIPHQGGMGMGMSRMEAAGSLVGQPLCVQKSATMAWWLSNAGHFPSATLDGTQGHQLCPPG